MGSDIPEFMYQFGAAHDAATWTTFGFQLFSTLVFLAVGYTTTSPKRKLFVNLATLSTAVSALAYLIMALGQASMKIGESRGWVYNAIYGEGRDFHWLHYADWAVTTPIQFSVLGLIAGVNWTEILFFIGCALLYVAAHFAGAITEGFNATWPLFTFGVVALLPVFFALVTQLPGRVASAARGTYNVLSAITLLSLVIYVMVWATGDGAAAQTPDQETICYAALDILSKTVFGFLLVFSGNALDAAGGIASPLSAKEVV